ncbi:MAG: hypothetical protein DMG01_23825 [Acidobacteria bacterium]|nr:MAG: hypothetical protein DMG01_23825 [Acidobacteriota bacterium]
MRISSGSSPCRSTACCRINAFQTISRSTRRTGSSLFVKLSQLGSTATARIRRRTAVLSSGISEKIRPGLDVTSSAGRWRSNNASAHGCETSRSINSYRVGFRTMDGANADASRRLARIHRIVLLAIAS